MTETARMYGGSLYDLAAEEGLEARILGELDEAVALFKANPDYLHLLSTPSIPKKERCGLLDEALRGQVHLYVLNFLKILCEKGTLRELGGCTRAYRIRYNEAHGILEATATSAIALTKEQTAALHQKLEALTGQHWDKLYIAGGGAKNATLNELTAHYTGKQVVALPIEATAIGNLKIQMSISEGGTV